jgi:hypothetical protein
MRLGVGWLDAGGLLERLAGLAQAAGPIRELGLDDERFGTIRIERQRQRRQVLRLGGLSSGEPELREMGGDERILGGEASGAGERLLGVGDASRAGPKPCLADRHAGASLVGLGKRLEQLLGLVPLAPVERLLDRAESWLRSRTRTAGAKEHAEEDRRGDGQGSFTLRT